MENNQFMQKTVFAILDVLLILGALACVLTINGGNWWFNGMTSYVAMQVALFDLYQPQTPAISGGISTQRDGAPTTLNLQTLFLLNNP